MKRQDRGLKREHDQYQLEAKITKENINLLPNKKMVVHYLHDLGDGNSMRAVSTMKLESIFQEMQSAPEFHPVLAFPAHGDIERESFFEEIFGKNNIIKFASMPELLYVIREIKPYIMHLHIDGVDTTEVESRVLSSVMQAIDSMVDHFIPLSLLKGKLPIDIDYKEAAEENLKLYRSK